jgi:ABC-2 type transport system ATP-binding protein
LNVNLKQFIPENVLCLFLIKNKLNYTHLIFKMHQEPVIEVKNVWKSFKTVQAVKGIDLKIMKGQFVALLGPNGAGKTTLVEMIEGIQKPDKGVITISGKKWKGNEDELHRIIGLALQETRFIDKLRVSETLLLFAGFFNLGKTRVNEIIDIVCSKSFRGTAAETCNRYCSDK